MSSEFKCKTCKKVFPTHYALNYHKFVVSKFCKTLIRYFLRVRNTNHQIFLSIKNTNVYCGDRKH